MPNLPSKIARLLVGKGVYWGDPLFLMPDGSVVDEEERIIQAASDLGEAAYADFDGFTPNANPNDEMRGGVYATEKGVGDTVEAKVGTDGKLYVPAYPADQYEMAGFVVEVDAVAAAIPELPIVQDDGYKLADQDTKKIYTLATVESTQTWGSGVALAAGKLYTDGTDIYVFGSGSLAKI